MTQTYATRTIVARPLRQLVPGGFIPTIALVAAALLPLAAASQAHAVVIEEQIADAQEDWDAALVGGPNPAVPEQGGLGWEFGFFSTDGNPNSFTQLGEFSGTRWIPSAAQNGTSVSPNVSRNTMHPGFQGSLNQRWSVRKWTSSAAGMIRVFGTANRTQDGTGDGLDLRFYLNNTELTDQTIPLAGNNNDVSAFDFFVDVEVGDFILFAADDRGNSSFDNLALSATMSQFVPEPTTGTILPFALMAAMVRRRRRAGRLQA